MDLAQILVTVGGAALVAAVLLFFFGPRRPRKPIAADRRSSMADRRL